MQMSSQFGAQSAPDARTAGWVTVGVVCILMPKELAHLICATIGATVYLLMVTIRENDRLQGKAMPEEDAGQHPSDSKCDKADIFVESRCFPKADATKTTERVRDVKTNRQEMVRFRAHGSSDDQRAQVNQNNDPGWARFQDSRGKWDEIDTTDEEVILDEGKGNQQVLTEKPNNVRRFRDWQNDAEDTASDESDKEDVSSMFCASEERRHRAHGSSDDERAHVNPNKDRGWARFQDSRGKWGEIHKAGEEVILDKGKGNEQVLTEKPTNFRRFRDWQNDAEETADKEDFSSMFCASEERTHGSVHASATIAARTTIRRFDASVVLARAELLATGPQFEPPAAAVSSQRGGRWRGKF